MTTDKSTTYVTKYTSYFCYKESNTNHMMNYMHWLNQMTPINYYREYALLIGHDDEDDFLLVLHMLC